MADVARVHHGTGRLYRGVDPINPRARLILLCPPERQRGWLLLDSDHILHDGERLYFCRGGSVIRLRIEGRNKPPRLGAGHYSWVVNIEEGQHRSVEALPFLGSIFAGDF